MAQVLRAWVKPDASSRVRDLCDKGDCAECETYISARFIAENHAAHAHHVPGLDRVMQKGLTFLPLAGQPTCAVVLKVVFDENEKNYEDWRDRWI